MFHLLIFIIGLVFGSFFNVCISRIPRKESIIFPTSHCPNCNAKIKPFDNIPLLSYLFLKGKCRNCGQKIHWHYPFVEFFTSLFFLLLFYKFGFSILFLKYLIFISFALIILFIDLFHKIIPDKLSLPLLIVGLLFSFLPASDIGLKAALIGAGFGFFLFLVTAVAFEKITKKESLGGGDIKLIAAIGAFLGFFGIVFTIILGSILAMLFLLISKHDRQKEFPFGPYLLLASLLYIFTADPMLQLYFTMF